MEGFAIAATLLGVSFWALFAIAIWRRFTGRRRTNLPLSALDRLYGATRPQAPVPPDDRPPAR
jgi:hypothetical protein